MTLPDNITESTEYNEPSDLSLTIEADTDDALESVEELREEAEVLRDVLAEANAELDELTDGLPAGTEAEIYRQGKRTYAEFSVPDDGKEG